MSQICTTLFDYPTIRQCSQLQNFIRKCVSSAWSLVSQVNILLRTSIPQNIWAKYRCILEAFGITSFMNSSAAFGITFTDYFRVLATVLSMRSECSDLMFMCDTTPATRTTSLSEHTSGQLSFRGPVVLNKAVVIT